MIKKTSEQGMVLVTAIIIIAALTIVGLALMSQVTNQYSLTTINQAKNNALYTAEAGVEQTIAALNTDDNFGGYPLPQVFFNNPTQGYGTFTATIAPGNANSKVITGTGNIYHYNDHNRLISSKTVRVTVVGTTSEGYSVYTGPGGLKLVGSANITNSSVYVNGKISLTGAAKIGTVNKPLEVDAANLACPTCANPGPSYPSLCSGVQPISLAQSTNIYGTVCATGQTSTGPNNNIQPGNGGQGLIVGCTAPSVSPPSYDRAGQIAAVTTTSGSTSNPYACQGGNSSITWPANLRLNGNVSIGSSCKVRIMGNVYITGTLTINGAATITVDNSLGTTPPIILADGKIQMNGSGGILTNSSGTSIKFISWASNAPCGNACTTITGTNLYNTSTYETIYVGGAVNVPGAIFQAYWGQVTIAGSGNIGSAVGQTVQLSGSGTVTFGTKIASGVSTWTISSYQIVYPGH